GLDFDVVYDAGAAPDEGDNPLADVINLFYANNWAHDFFHAYGFDEASGNFQQNNYGNGGAGGDPVRAEALDGYGLSSPNTNNANFATPPDGFPGRMQMYGFTFSDPHRSSSLDNGIVLHEYGHGWSVRLTGGRTNVTCLPNTEQMGEGWCDYAALVATLRPGDAGTDARGIGAWAIGQTDTGRGIRAYPYSTDLGVDPRTYDEIRSSSVPHGLGSTWAAMLWEMTWALIDQHGFDPDVVHGTGGNNLAMQLVSDGLKLQPCRPGFVDGRDAIIQADRLGNGGANECLIWEAFAKRGLGWGADQGSSDSRSDGIESFELPPFCPLDLRVDVPSGLLSSGDTATFALTVDHRGVTREDALVVVDELGPGLELVLGSTACDRTTGIDETTADVTIRLERLDPGDRLSCTYRVEVTGAAAPAVTVLSAGFDETLEPFAIFRDDGGVDWTTSSSDAGTGTGSAYATNPSTSGGVGDDTSDQSLITPTMTIAPCSTLSFSHRFDTESFYDGGVVEIRQGSGSWIDLGSDIIVGGYTQTIASLATTNSAISGRRAFAGDSGGFVSTVVDLADHVGDAAMVRFRYVSDFSVGSAGWWIDDVVVERAAGTSHTARLSSGGGTDASTSSCLAVEGDVVAPTTTAPVPTTEQPTPPTTTGPPEEGPTEPPNDAPTDDPARTTPSPPPIEGGGIDPELLEAASRLGSG
ncbi:MAG: M36 family metallopeptidase, partial [Actinomycetota bacterium]